MSRGAVSDELPEFEVRLAERDPPQRREGVVYTTRIRRRAERNVLSTFRDSFIVTSIRQLMGARRRELIVDAVVEAARSVMAHQIVRERRCGCAADVTGEEAEALQTLRDALAVERRSRRDA